MSMDIYAKPGTKVKFAFPSAGYPQHQETAKKYLKRRKTYTVEMTKVYSWHTDVYLKEVPGVAFNSVLFS